MFHICVIFMDENTRRDACAIHVGDLQCTHATIVRTQICTEFREVYMSMDRRVYKMKDLLRTIVQCSYLHQEMFNKTAFVPTVLGIVSTEFVLTTSGVVTRLFPANIDMVLNDVHSDLGRPHEP